MMKLLIMKKIYKKEEEIFIINLYIKICIILFSGMKCEIMKMNILLNFNNFNKF